MIRFIAKTLLLALSLCMLGSCKHAKGPVQGEANRPETPMELLDMYDMLAHSYRPWTDVYMPVTLSLEKPAQMSISGRCHMLRDSLIYMSLRMIGMEVATILVTSDSALIVDKYHKCYVAESLSAITARFPMTIGNIQDLLIGQAFVPGGLNLAQADASNLVITDSDFAPSTEADVWSLGDDSEAWWCNVNDQDPPRITAIAMQASPTQRAEFVYTDFAETSAGPIASSVTIYADIPTLGQPQARISWRPDKASWNSGKSPKLRAPSGYRRLDATSLLRSLSSPK